MQVYVVSVSGYSVFLKSLSYDKESEVTIVEQALYTDNLEEIYATNERNDPGTIHVYINTISGTGGTQVLEMLTVDDVPRRVSKSWSKNQTFSFYDMKPGGYYRFNITSASKGTFPLYREYITYKVTYPATPIQYSYTPFSDITTVTVSFYVYGVVHGWIIKLVLFL